MYKERKKPYINLEVTDRKRSKVNQEALIEIKKGFEEDYKRNIEE